jgi:hypothetical protein
MGVGPDHFAFELEANWVAKGGFQSVDAKTRYWAILARLDHRS